MTEKESTLKSFALRIPKVNLNQFFNTIQFLSKIGKEVMIEVDEDNTVLRSLNDAKSAFASVEFGRDYFDSYTLNVPDGEVFACKLSIKPLCVILKNAKRMQYLQIHNSIKDEVEHELVFSMQCDHGIRRTHRFIYQDSDIVSAMFDESASSCLQCQPKVLSELFTHIHAKWSEEIAFDIGPRSFRLRTFHHDRGAEKAQAAPAIGRAHMSSEMCINPSSEFDVYDFKATEPQEIVVCVKELRALLWLCEVAEVTDLSFFITEAGRPVKLGFDMSVLHDNRGAPVITLVMATLEPHNRSHCNHDGEGGEERVQHTPCGADAEVASQQNRQSIDTSFGVGWRESSGAGCNAEVADENVCGGSPPLVGNGCAEEDCGEPGGALSPDLTRLAGPDQHDEVGHEDEYCAASRSPKRRAVEDGRGQPSAAPSKATEGSRPSYVHRRIIVDEDEDD